VGCTLKMLKTTALSQFLRETSFTPIKNRKPHISNSQPSGCVEVETPYNIIWTEMAYSIVGLVYNN